MSARRQVTALFSVLLLLCLVGQALTVRRLDQMRPEATLEEILYIPSAKVLKRLCLGYDGLLADIYWTRAVQYFGGKLTDKRTKSKRYDLLYPLLDITTDLDPHLIPAYEFGATFLTQTPPMGAGQADKAVLLLQKGVAANPDRWQLYFHLGFVNYLELKDYPAAANAFQHAGEMPGGNPNVLPMAGWAATRGGDIETAKRLWQIVYDTTKLDLVKKNAYMHLQGIAVDETVPLLQQAVERYKLTAGHDPQSWHDLERAGIVQGVPLDPNGTPYKLVGGRVELAQPDKLPFATKGLPPGSEPSNQAPSDVK
jgi:tetratricopeptide (TPR) repeat protein